MRTDNPGIAAPDGCSESEELHLETAWMLPSRSCQGDGMHQCTVPSVLCAGTAALNRCIDMIDHYELCIAYIAFAVPRL